MKSLFYFAVYIFFFIIFWLYGIILCKRKICVLEINSNSFIRKLFRLSRGDSISLIAILYQIFFIAISIIFGFCIMKYEPIRGDFVQVYPVACGINSQVWLAIYVIGERIVKDK